MRHDTADPTLTDPLFIEQTVHFRPAEVAGLLAVERVAHALVFISGEPGRRVPVGPDGIMIGRQAPADLVLEDSAVSRRHCQLELDGDALSLTDLGSTNGTFVDGQRVTARLVLSDGMRLRIGPHELRYERRRQSDMEATQGAERDVARARAYVDALLPPPVTERPVQADWVFRPCAALGGDAFGYQMLGPDWFTAYILDVAGHGVGSAMHSVSVMTVLRQRALPGTDMCDPAAVLRGLNAMFDMDTHHGLYFTAWYCSYHLPTRCLAFASAGHHAALLKAPVGAPVPLGQRQPAIGMRPDYPYAAGRAELPHGSRLYLFSDGAFEIAPPGAAPWTLQSMAELLQAPARPGLSEPERLYRATRAAAPPGPLEDDVSVLELRFA
jgi:serine phosphatase RsbU (regulator of sigma subunit)